MKKILSLLLVLTVVFGLTACNNQKTTSDLTVVKVGASPTPHKEILNQIVDDMKAKGYDLQIVDYTDYVLPNVAVEDGELDANYFQHTPYMEWFNDEKDTHLVSVASIHYEPLGIYPSKATSLDTIADGATVLIPNDSTNRARALLLLEAAGLIKLTEGVGVQATLQDVIENPKNLVISEAEAASEVVLMPDAAVAVLNGNYALGGGFAISDALLTETSDSVSAQTYANIITVKAGNEKNAGILALVECLKSDKVRDYINSTYNGSVVPLF